MHIHEYGDDRKPILVLIHGMLVPHTVFDTHVERFKERYHVLVPVLDGHDGNPLNDFTTAEQQAQRILEHIRALGYTSIFAVCGVSLGGIIAYELWKASTLPIRYLLLDGAPLCGSPKWLAAMMRKKYVDIVAKSKARDPKTLENFAKHFLPQELLEDYLLIADTISTESVRALCAAAAVNRLRLTTAKDTRMLFMYGSGMSEILSARAAKRLKKEFPSAVIHRFYGERHCHPVLYDPMAWCTVVEGFFLNDK